MSNRQVEYKLAVSISEYLQLQHRDIIFKFTNDDGNLTMQQAVRAKKLNPYKGFMDLWIFEPNEKYCGLFIELKASKDLIYKKDGGYKKSKHLESQIAMRDALTKKGYYCCFGWDLKQVINIINQYMEN